MSKENVSIRIFGRDMTFSVSPKEKNNLIKSAEILNNELENISDKWIYFIKNAAEFREKPADFKSVSALNPA